MTPTVLPFSGKERRSSQRSSTLLIYAIIGFTLLIGAMIWQKSSAVSSNHGYALTELQNVIRLEKKISEILQNGEAALNAKTLDALLQSSNAILHPKATGNYSKSRLLYKNEISRTLEETLGLTKNAQSSTEIRANLLKAQTITSQWQDALRAEIIPAADTLSQLNVFLVFSLLLVGMILAGYKVKKLYQPHDKVYKSGSYTQEKDQNDQRHRVIATLNEIAGNILNRHKSCCIFTISTRETNSIGVMFGADSQDSVVLDIYETVYASVRKHDLIVRLNKDTLLVLGTRMRNRSDMQSMVERLAHLLNQPIRINGLTLRINTDLGVTYIEKPMPEAGFLYIQQAEYALQLARESNIAKTVFFSKALQDKLSSKVRLANDIVYAIQKEHISPNYQPRFDVNADKILGIEALARLTSSANTVLKPGDFLNLAKEINMSFDISLATFIQARNDMLDWQKENIDCKTLFINIFAKDLLDKRKIKEIILNLNKKISLIIEVEDIEPHANDEKLCENLQLLKHHGVGIIAETHNPSIIVKMSKHIDLHSIKLPMADSSDKLNSIILRDIEKIAKQLSVPIIATNIETETEFDSWKHRGANYIQGYYISKPMDSIYAEEWLYSRQNLKPGQQNVKQSPFSMKVFA